MIGKGVEDKGFASVDDVYEVLKERKKSAKPMTYEQQIAFEYAEKFKVPKKQHEKVKKALQETGLLSDMAIENVLSVMPKSAMLLKQILTKEKTTPSDEDVKKILGILNEKG